jgi:hypothetical protein
MRILTLAQPWATLMAVGAKLIETRSWYTPYRGPVAIHASKAIPDLCGMSEPIIRAALVAGGFSDHGLDLPRGRIVAVAELTDCLRMVVARVYHGPSELCIETECDKRLTFRERAFGGYSPGRFAWITDPSKLRRVNLLYRGAQGLRNLPPDIAAQLVGA